METILVCVNPDASSDIYSFFDTHFRGHGWESYVIPVTDVAEAHVLRPAAVIAHASNWPQPLLHKWLADIRATIGPRKQLLAILPRPPCEYTNDTQALWNKAVGYGFKIHEVTAIIRGFIAGVD